MAIGGTRPIGTRSGSSFAVPDTMPTRPAVDNHQLLLTAMKQIQDPRAASPETIHPEPLRPLFRGTICRIACQCTDPETGIVGDWLFTGDDWREAGSRVTPVFDSFYELCQWTNRGRWAQVGHGSSFAYLYQGSFAEHGSAVESAMLRNHPSLF